MNKFTRLTVLGSTIITVITVMGISIAYFGIKQALEDKHLSKRRISTNPLDSIQIKTVTVEKLVHDTIRLEAPCSRKHYDNAPINNKERIINTLDSTQKDSQIHNGY
jgi:hypothetical protein